MNLEQATILALQNKLNEYVEVNPDDMNDFYLVDVYKVCMDTYSGKRLYLAQNNPNVSNWKDAKTYEWQFNSEGAMEFNSEEEATEFARKYFKHFNKWYIYKTKAYR